MGPVVEALGVMACEFEDTGETRGYRAHRSRIACIVALTSRETANLADET